MSVGSDQDFLLKLPELKDIPSTYGFEVNRLDVDDLFSLYRRTGFLYPAKAARLLPQLALVRDNWRRLLEAGSSLLYVLTSGSVGSGRGLASIAVWRTTRNGWTWQHHVSDKNPLGSRAIMLGGLAACIRRGEDESHENWFRPENRFPARVFGSMVPTLGESVSAVRRHLLFGMSRASIPVADRTIRVVRYDRSHHEALCALAVVDRGSVYVRGEELDVDVGLREVNELYRDVGLRRTREVWLAYANRRGDMPAGAALAYRGPLGINFSYIENRCDVLLDPTLPEDMKTAVIASLLNASAAAYFDFEAREIPIIADQIAAASLSALGAEYLREYCQGIWLKAGQMGLYRHVDSFYTRALQRAERQQPDQALTA
jgi:hypothetical protein